MLLFQHKGYLFALGAMFAAISKVHDEPLFMLGSFLWLLYLFGRRKIDVFCAVGVLLVSILMWVQIPSSDLSNGEVTEKTGTTEMTGKITGHVTANTQKVEFVLLDKAKQRHLITYFVEDGEDIRSFIPSTGAHCQFTADKQIPPRAKNPHQFDYQQYLWKKGISSQFILSEVEQLHCTPPSWQAVIFNLRTVMMSRMEGSLQPDTYAWLFALVFGDDSRLDEELIDTFQRWGLSHLLAISGLHVGIIVGLIYVVLIRFSVVTKETAQTVVMLFLPAYAVIAGGQPSVWRASLMVAFVVFFAKLKWKVSLADMISFVFLLLLFLNPYFIYHIGFQLSFAVTFSLILSGKWLSQSSSKTGILLQISFVSQMAILPLQLYYFHLFQPLSILLNLLIVPYFSLFVIPAMFVFLLLSPIPGPFILMLETLFHLLHDQAIAFIMLVDRYLDYPFIIGELTMYYLIVYYVIFFVMMIAVERQRLKKAFQYGCLLSFYIIFLAIRPYLSPYGVVTMLDIGQGDAFVIELPYRKGVFFVDAGAHFSFTDFKPTDRIYRQVIRPYLYGQGIQKIDVIFLSHEDLDHDGSVPYILEDFPVDEIIVSEWYEPDEQPSDNWLRKQYQAVFHETISRKGQLFQVVSPYRKTDSANENSLVLYTELGGLKWIFTGDAGKETEQLIMKHYPDLTVDVLKVGHHGSNTSTDPAFAEKASGGIAFISVGEQNRYGHPTKEVISTLEDAGLEIYRTDENGAVQVYFKGDEHWILPFLDEEM